MSGMEDTLKGILQTIERKQRATDAAREVVPCHFDVSLAGECSDEYRAGCEWRQNDDLCARVMVQIRDRKRADARLSARRRGIPERVLRSVFDVQPTETPAIRAVRAFMRSDKSILVLSGSNACGKTTAAAWACLPPEGEGWGPGQFLRLVDLESAGRFSDLLSDARSARLLVLDDVGAAHFGQSGFMVSMVDDVVDAVYQACNKVILTTDLAVAPDPKDPGRPCLAKLLSRRVLSRIKDAGMVETKLGGRHEGDR